MKVSSIIFASLISICNTAIAQPLDMLSSTVNLRLDLGNDVNQIVEGEGTLLQVALKSKNVELAKLLVESGANTNLVSDADDQPPLTLAIRLDDFEILTFLIENGADLDSEDSQGRTPLFKSLKPDRTETRMFLIENGADVNKTANNKTTAIIEAIASNNVNAIDQLLENDATANGKLVANTSCDTCHGEIESANNVHPYIPSLAGQNADYIASQLGDYRKKARVLGWFYSRMYLWKRSMLHWRHTIQVFQEEKTSLMAQWKYEPKEKSSTTPLVPHATGVTESRLKAC